MRRLTYRVAEGIAVVDPYFQVRYSKDELITILVGRVADYEDTGLEPKQIIEADNFLKKNWYIPLARLRGALELIMAKDSGRLVVVPCKVGEFLYEVDLPEYGVITCKAISIGYYNGPMFHVPGNKVVSSLTVEIEVIDGHGKGSSYNFEIDDFGKTVFLSREEAEEALREDDHES